MSADTLAARIREIAKQHEPVSYRDHSDAWIQCSCGWGSFGTNGEEWMQHFTSLSELSAAEQAARKEERELCCKDVCKHCRDTTIGKAAIIEDIWAHRVDSEHFTPCLAASIRNRE